jgi:predicted metal-dependent hydrolase
VTSAVAREARRLGVRPGRIGVRDPRTRWGSCSSNGNLSFSWRLVIAPLEVLEYVVVHELCHLRELNHSKRFYRLLDDARPRWREEASWLRDFGWELHEYRP